MKQSDPPLEHNPFERYDLDPTEGPQGITERLRELAEDAEDEMERARIREAWEALTMHPRRRLDLALGAHPAFAPPGTSPRPPRPFRFPAPPPPTLADAVAVAALADLLGRGTEAAQDLSLDRDPILAESGDPSSDNR